MSPYIYNLIQKMTSIRELLPEINGIGLVSDLPKSVWDDPDMTLPKTFDKENSIYLILNETLGFVSISDFQNVFDTLCFLNNKLYICTSDLTHKFPIDPDSNLGKKMYDPKYIEKLDSLKSCDIIPEKLKSKFCICFGQKVLAHTDTYEEATKLSETEFQYLATTIYVPEFSRI